jgi:intracellular sulfur oxidation DsrE/DsrF family protein
MLSYTCISDGRGYLYGEEESASIMDMPCDSKRSRHILLITLLLQSLVVEIVVAEGALGPEEAPELDEILHLVNESENSQGVLLHTREYDEDAYIWVAPRLEYYVSLLRERYPEIPLIVISHGDEMRSLTVGNKTNYPDIHQTIQGLVEKHQVEFQVCASFANYNDIDVSEFPDYIQVIPSAPAAFTDYRELGFDLIEIELSW